MSTLYNSILVFENFRDGYNSCCNGNTAIIYFGLHVYYKNILHLKYITCLLGI